tara:strand:- start:524 stop:892 length:369 start_codon:yes stop_codon:yes gene_type:complete
MKRILYFIVGLLVLALFIFSISRYSMLKIVGIPLHNYESCIDIKFNSIDFEELEKIRNNVERKLNCTDCSIEAFGFNVYILGYKLLKLNTNRPSIEMKESVLQIIDDIGTYKYEVTVSSNSI